VKQISIFHTCMFPPMQKAFKQDSQHFFSNNRWWRSKTLQAIADWRGGQAEASQSGGQQQQLEDVARVGAAAPSGRRL
jgi:hypothetical protein